MPVADLCREHAMSAASFYKGRSRYGGMDTSMVLQMKALKDKNRRLKKMFAEFILSARMNLVAGARFERATFRL